jgi:hypothetical protein
MVIGRTLAVLLGATIVVAGALPASAQVVVKGTGKTSVTFIRWNEGTNQPVSTKAAGSIQSKPKVGTALLPTGGSTTQLKLPFQPGPTIDPLKPGFPTGDYVLQIETSDTPTGDVNTSAFVVLHIDSLGKCTPDANPTIDGDAPTDWCNQSGNPACVNTIAGKCTFTTYQVSGSLSGLAPGAGQPAASRVRLRKKIPAGNCLSGDIITAGNEIRANNSGAFDVVNHDCADGAVVAVGGVANADRGF